MANKGQTEGKQKATSKECKKERKEEIDKPDDISQQVWEDFLEHRTSIKKKVTNTVVSRIRNEANKAGWSMDDALSELCMRGWQGFKAEWVQNQHTKRTGFARAGIG